VVAIAVADMNAGFQLALNQTREIVFREAGEVSLERTRLVVVEGITQSSPGQAVVANNALFRQLFDGARAEGVSAGSSACRYPT